MLSGGKVSREALTLTLTLIVVMIAVVVDLDHKCVAWCKQKS